MDGSVEGGFFYEMSLPKGFTIREEKFFPELEAEMGRILSDKQNFEKLHVSKDFAAKMFSYNPFQIGYAGTNSRDVSYLFCHPLNNKLARFF